MRGQRGRCPSCCAAVLLSRSFAVLAAALFVLAFALAMLTHGAMSLLEGLARLDPGLPHRVHHLLAGAFHGFVWQRLALPLLVRPVWLVPACLGLVCAGVAATASVPDAAQTRRQS